jgi:hypothetical protein
VCSNTFDNILNVSGKVCLLLPSTCTGITSQRSQYTLLPSDLHHLACTRTSHTVTTRQPVTCARYTWHGMASAHTQHHCTAVIVLY